MKLACAILCALSLGAAAATAQSTSRSFGVAGMETVSPAWSQGQRTNVHTIVVNQAPVYPRCPVTMRAQHLADGEMIKTGGARPQGIGQWLHLTFMAPDSRRIAKAALTIRGVNSKGRVMQAAEAGDGSSDATTTRTVEFTAGAGRQDVADLWVPGMTAVRSIDVNSVSYADGETWKLAGNLDCRVAPDALMLTRNR
jgi:hypothetical protein